MRESGLGGWEAGTGESEEGALLRSRNRGLADVLAGKQLGETVKDEGAVGKG